MWWGLLILLSWHILRLISTGSSFTELRFDKRRRTGIDIKREGLGIILSGCVTCVAGC